MTDRTALAIAACQGLSDAELAERGAGGYLKIRDRKRQYSAAAKQLHVVAMGMAAQIKSLKATIKAQQEQMVALEKMDAPVKDVSEAAALLAAIGKKSAAQ